ncbi:MAG: DMT family transporter [bacterium]
MLQNTNRGSSLSVVLKLLAVTLLWSLCFPLITTGLAGAPPLYFAALRAAAAGVFLIGAAAVARRPFPTGASTWLVLSGLGVSYTALGFGGMFLAGGKISPGLAQVLANTQPLIAAVLAFAFLGVKPGKGLGVVLMIGFAGIVLVALPGFTGADRNSNPAGVAFVLLGAAGIAVGNVVLKRYAKQIDPLMATGWQFLLGSVPLAVGAGIFEKTASIHWSLSFVLVLLTLAIPGTAVASALWFSLVRHGELNRLNVYTFLTPLFALLLGAAFYSERLSLLEFGGTAVVLSATALAAGVRPASLLSGRSFLFDNIL